LWQLGYKVKAPFNLRPKHIDALIESWKEKGICAGEFHSRISMINILLSWVKKESMCRSVRDICPNDEMRRKTVAQENKSWTAKGCDVGEIIAKALVLDERFACVIALCAAFGLRLKEGVEMRPRRAVKEGGGCCIKVVEGTKGGRPRFVDVKTDGQREVLEWAVRIAAVTQSARMRWPGKTWEEAQSHFYRLLKKIGVTRDQLGVTMHGLRHEFAQENYTYISGLPPPIAGGALDRIDCESHEDAALYVSEQLGHGRKYVGGTYYGSYAHKLRGVPATPQERMGREKQQADERA
jgi:integrase